MKKEMFCLYIDDKFKEELRKEAKLKGLSLNSYIIMLLHERGK